MIYLTARNSSGGNHGHQLKDLIGGYTIAKVFNFEYVHSYYPYLEFFAVGYKEKKVDELDENISYLRYSTPSWEGIKFKKAAKVLGGLSQKFLNDDALVSVENAFRVFPCQTIKWQKEGLITRPVFEEVYTGLSTKYGQKHSNRPHGFENGIINIAVHINRGQNYDREKYPYHFASDWNVRYMFGLDYFATIFGQLRLVLAGKEFLIHIYTEALNSEEIVGKFSNDKDVVLHIGKNRNEADYELVRHIFHDFVSSDIFVPCNSSFSAMASYYRKGKPTIYHPHRDLFDLPETDFYATDPLGNFDYQRLQNAIGATCQW